MIPFDGASVWGKFMLCFAGGALLACWYTGPAPLIAVGIVGYWLLKFCNRLEARDLRDIQQEKRKTRRQ